MGLQASSSLCLFVVSSLLVATVSCARPEFVERLTNQTVPVGREATFTCVVKNLGGYRVGWVKTETKAIQAIHTHVITHNPRVRVSHRDQSTWNLHIRNVQEEDRGTYMCQINYNPMLSQYGYLNVVVPPDIISEESSGDITIPEGGSSELRCKASGYPTPTIQWRRLDNELLTAAVQTPTGQLVEKKVEMYEGEVLRLVKVRRSDTGPYLCIASNGLPPSVSKKINVEVHFHPVLQVPDQVQGVPLGKTVTIRCHVAALPKSINYWIKEEDVSDVLLLNSTKHVITEEPDSYYSAWMSLTVNSFEASDAGYYICVAKNSIGEVRSQIQLHESRMSHQPPPPTDVVDEEVDGITYTASAGDQARFPGRVTSDLESYGDLVPAGAADSGGVPPPPPPPPPQTEGSSSGGGLPGLAPIDAGALCIALLLLLL